MSTFVLLLVFFFIHVVTWKTDFTICASVAKEVIKRHFCVYYVYPCGLASQNNVLVLKMIWVVFTKKFIFTIYYFFTSNYHAHADKLMNMIFFPSVFSFLLNLKNQRLLLPKQLISPMPSLDETLGEKKPACLF